MPGQQTTQATPALLTVGRWAAALTTLLGAVVLLGRAVGILPTLAAMNPNTASCFVLSGIGLWLLHDRAAPLWHRRVALGLSLIVESFAVLTLAEYALGWRLWIDQFLLLDTSEGSTFPGRMSLMAALMFALAGWALALMPIQRPRPQALVQLLAAAVGVLAIVALLDLGEEAERLLKQGSAPLERTVQAPCIKIPGGSVLPAKRAVTFGVSEYLRLLRNLQLPWPSRSSGTQPMDERLAKCPRAARSWGRRTRALEIR